MGKYFVAAFVASFALLGGLSTGVLASPSIGRLQPSDSETKTWWVGEAGEASFYGAWHHGRMSASGVKFDKKALTAAHPWLPFGTKVRVVLAGTGRSVVVTITDRLYSNHRIVDLSQAAAERLGIIRQGVAEVTLLPA